MRAAFVAIALVLAACEPADDMGLPLDREETATAAAPVKSNTINVIQDMIKGRKHGLVTVQVSPLRWVGSQGGAGVPLIYTISETFWPTGVGASSFMLGLELPLGSVIYEIRGIVKPGAGNVMRLRFGKSVAGVGTELDHEDSTVAGADNTLTLTGPFEAIAAGRSYMISAFRQSGATESESVKLLEYDIALP